MNKINQMIDFIYQSPTSFQAVENIKNILLENNFKEFNEAKPHKFNKGDKCFVTRNQTSIIAFIIGDQLDNPSFNMVASHSDCPSYKLKPNSIIKENGYTKLNTEGYGGMIRQSWMDRGLSVAGRVLVNDNGIINSTLVNVDKDLMVIPSVAIHLSRDEQAKLLNQQVDMLPIVSVNDSFDLKAVLANELKCESKDIINYDLYLYPRIKGFVFDEMIASYHLDNLECAYTSLIAFLESTNQETVNVFACFDNEEVGSKTRQGAASTLLDDVLSKVANDCGFDYSSALANSLMVSADNAHALHPNHPQKSDATNRTFMNKGIVIKYNANQSYTTDALSAALFIQCLNKADVPYQYYTNRSDLVGGGTLGYVSSSVVSVLSVDIGLAQLAMHSTLEIAGTKDVNFMINGLKAYYSSKIEKLHEGSYIVK